MSVIWWALAVMVTFGIVCLVILGGLSVWMRDEHAPTWIPPEPSRIEPHPGPYDWDDVDDA